MPLSFANMEEQIADNDLPTVILVEVGNDHRLADPEPLQTMFKAFNFMSTEIT